MLLNFLLARTKEPSTALGAGMLWQGVHGIMVAGMTPDNVGMIVLGLVGMLLKEARNTES